MPRASGSIAPIDFGWKKGRIFTRNCVCSGGSIRFSIGVTGWTFVSTCAGVVPFATDSAWDEEWFHTSSKRDDRPGVVLVEVVDGRFGAQTP